MLIVSVMPRTYGRPRHAGIAITGHLWQMAGSGYLTGVRGARLPRQRPTARCVPACGGCWQRGDGRYASSAPAALRSRDRSDHVATQDKISRSRSVSRIGSASLSRCGGVCAGTSASRHARATESTSPCHGKCALPCSGMNVAPGIAAATSRPSRNGMARSSRRCTTVVGARTAGRLVPHVETIDESQ